MALFQKSVDFRQSPIFVILTLSVVRDYGKRLEFGFLACRRLRMMNQHFLKKSLNF